MHDLFKLGDFEALCLDSLFGCTQNTSAFAFTFAPFRALFVQCENRVARTSLGSPVTGDTRAQ